MTINTVNSKGENCVINIKKAKRTLKDKLFIVSLLVVPIIQFLIFWVYVNASSIALAFQDLDGTFSFKWFALFFEEISLPDSNIYIGIINTLKYFALGFIVINPGAFLVAFFLYKKIKFYKFFRIVFFLPSIISSVILTSLYSELLMPDGLIADILRAFGMTDIPVFLADSRYATGAIMIYMLWTGFGVNIILFSSAMARIPEEVMESASLDGAGILRELWNFAIPLTMPTLITVLTLSVAGIFTASGPILLFTQGSFETWTIGYWIYDKVAGYSANYNYGSAVGIFFTVLGMILTLTSRALLNKFDTNVEY